MKMKLCEDLFIDGEKRVFSDFINNKFEDVINDTEYLIKNYGDTVTKILKEQKEVNVLMTGITGSGKSSLINLIFGKNVAKIGCGTSITKHYKKYSINGLNIYDSRGLEHGNVNSFIHDTKIFLKNHCEKNKIHVIWYVINSASSRWQPFEEYICSKIFSRIPVMFILNKSDIASSKDIGQFYNCISKIGNCTGIYKTVAARKKDIAEDIEICSMCKSDDLIIRKKSNDVICLDCHNSECLDKFGKWKNSEHNKLAEDTSKLLSKYIIKTFVSNQQVSLTLKNKTCCKIISKYWKNWEKITRKKKFAKVMTKFIASLSVVWGYHGEYGEYLSNDILAKCRINVLFHFKKHKQRIHCISWGILWNSYLFEITESSLDLFGKIKKEELCFRLKNMCMTIADKKLNIDSLTFIENKLKRINDGGDISNYF